MTKQNPLAVCTNCGNCFYRLSKSVFSSLYFCLIRLEYIDKENDKEFAKNCEFALFNSPDVSDELKAKMAIEKVREYSENVRLNKILLTNWWLIIVTFFSAFIAFVIAAKWIK